MRPKTKKAPLFAHMAPPVVLMLSLLLSGCSNTDASTEKVRVFPPTTQPSADAASATILRTFPPAVGVAGHSAREVADAETVFADAIAHEAADPAYICSAFADPYYPYESPSTQQWSRTQSRSEYTVLQNYGLASKQNRTPCKQLRFVGSGIIVGDQHLTVGAGPNGGLSFAYTGYFEWQMATAKNVAAPFGVRESGVYNLRKEGTSTWAIDSWTRHFPVVAPGWLPNHRPTSDYMPATPAAPSSGSSVDAVRAAVSTWRNQTAVRGTVTLGTGPTASPDGQVWNLWPTAGVAVLIVGSQTSFTLDRSMTYYERYRLGTDAPLPGVATSYSPTYLRSTATSADRRPGITVPTDPFAWTDALSEGQSAREDRCGSWAPSGARCYTVTLDATESPSGPSQSVLNSYLEHADLAPTVEVAASKEGALAGYQFQNRWMPQYRIVYPTAVGTTISVTLTTSRQSVPALRVPLPYETSPAENYGLVNG